MEGDRLSPERTGVVPLIFPDPTALVRAAAAEILRRGRRAAREKGRFDLVLAGGSTPLALYHTLGRSSSARASLWRRTHLFWGDERIVPPADPASNYGTAWTSGLDRLAVPPDQVHRAPGEGGNARRAAVIYETDLRTCFPGAAWPRFDLILLGLGTDGHVASLFPGSVALAERERWVAVAEGGTPEVPRVTLTMPVLNSAACVLFLVSGAGKAQMLERMQGPARLDPVPAQRVRPARGELRVFADAAAARVGERMG